MSPSSPPRALPVARPSRRRCRSPLDGYPPEANRPRPLPESTRSARDFRVQFEQLGTKEILCLARRALLTYMQLTVAPAADPLALPALPRISRRPRGAVHQRCADRFASVFRHRRQDSDTTLRAVSINEDTTMTPVTRQATSTRRAVPRTG